MANWYPWYPGDFIRDTAHLTLEEQGAYRRLIDHYMMTEQPIPSDIHKIRRILSCSLQKTRKFLPIFLQFFEEKNGFLYHKKCDFEIDKALKFREKQRANANARWDAKRMPPQPQPQPQKDNKKKSIKKKKFTKPTIQEIRDYIAENHFGVDPDIFWDWNESKGWRVGNGPMKDWKASIRTWERRDKARHREKDITPYGGQEI